MDVFIGTIMPFGFNFPPVNWATCNGQLLPISQYNALFALISTYYGGNGVQNFAVPNLCGRVPIGFGAGTGLPSYTLGESAGTPSVTLTTAQMPAHNHTVLANPGNPQAAGNLQVSVQVAGTASSPVNAPTTANNVLGASGNGQQQAAIWSSAMAAPVNMAGVSVNTNAMVGTAGNNLPVDIMNPFLALNFCIAVNGIFPSHQ